MKKKQAKIIACDIYDQLILHAQKKDCLEIRFSNNEEIRIQKGIIEDIFTKDKVEYLLLEGCKMKFDLNSIKSFKVIDQEKNIK